MHPHQPYLHLTSYWLVVNHTPQVIIAIYADLGEWNRSCTCYLLASIRFGNNKIHQRLPYFFQRSAKGVLCLIFV